MQKLSGCDADRLLDEYNGVWVETIDYSGQKAAATITLRECFRSCKWSFGYEVQLRDRWCTYRGHQVQHAPQDTPCQGRVEALEMAITAIQKRLEQGTLNPRARKEILNWTERLRQIPMLGR